MWFLSWLFYGQIIIATTQICDPSFSKLVHSWNHLFTSHSVSRKPTHPPVFIAPRILVYRKMWFLWLNRRYLPIFDGFLPVVQSNINRFRNSFHSQIALGKLYNTAAQTLSRHKLHSMKIIIETFSGDDRFPCVSSVVFKANSIWILQNVFACQSEHFDTTHDFLGRKLTKLENCIFRSARDRFRKRRLYKNRYNKSIFCLILKRTRLAGRILCLLNSTILEFMNFENS